MGTLLHVVCFGETLNNIAIHCWCWFIGDKWVWVYCTTCNNFHVYLLSVS